MDYDKAMKVQTEAEAAAVFTQLVKEHLDSPIAQKENRTIEQAREIELENIGYHAGYFNSETRARVERLFGTKHPHLGAIAETGEVSAEECYLLGLQFGMLSRVSKE